MLSDPFIDDPAETLTPPTPAASKDVRRNPTWTSPTAARSTTVNRYVEEQAPLQVAARPIHPSGTSVVKRASRSTESSVLKRTSHETEVTDSRVVRASVTSDDDAAPVPPARAIVPRQPRLLDFDVPVNPLR